MRVGYAGFISRRHAANGNLAPAAQFGLHRFAPLQSAILIWVSLFVLVATDATPLRAASFHTNHAARLYALGQATAQDYEKAKEGYEEAAAAGDAKAMTSLGYLYDVGRGVPQDYQMAREWYEKAAAAGNATAMNNLALALPAAAAFSYHSRAI